MKKLFVIVASLLTLPALAQDPKGLTYEQVNEELGKVYTIYESQKQDIASQIEQTTDTSFMKALLFQWKVLDEKCNSHVFAECFKLSADNDAAVENLFRLRTYVDKELVEAAYSKLKAKQKKLPYGELLKAYVDASQIQIGEEPIDFSFESQDGEKLSINHFMERRKDLVMIFGNKSCMTPEQMSWINRIYSSVDRSRLELLFFDMSATNVVELKALALENKSEWLTVSDFKGENSPATLSYNVESLPTVVCVTMGKVESWTVGDTEVITDRLTRAN